MSDLAQVTFLPFGTDMNWLTSTYELVKNPIILCNMILQLEIINNLDYSTRIQNPLAMLLTFSDIIIFHSKFNQKMVIQNEQLKKALDIIFQIICNNKDSQPFDILINELISILVKFCKIHINNFRLKSDYLVLVYTFYFEKYPNINVRKGAFVIEFESIKQLFSSLHYAIETNNFVEIQDLSTKINNKGFDIDFCIENKSSLLIAIEKEDKEMIVFLLQYCDAGRFSNLIKYLDYTNNKDIKDILYSYHSLDYHMSLDL